MGIEYRELRLDDEFDQCLELQRKVFGFSETDIVSPLFFKLIARGNPPIGISVGVFSSDNDGTRLIGLALGFATFVDKSAYIVLLGLLPEYQGSAYGFRLIQKFREIARSKGLQYIYGIYEPLESNLARLYIGSFGAIGIQYIPDSEGNPFPADKILFMFDFDFFDHGRDASSGQKESFSDAFARTPLASAAVFPDARRVLVEIPSDWLKLKADNPENALVRRMESRVILNEYVSIRKYVVMDCITGKVEGTRKSYYVLAKR